MVCLFAFVCVLFYMFTVCLCLIAVIVGLCLSLLLCHGTNSTCLYMCIICCVTINLGFHDCFFDCLVLHCWGFFVCVDGFA